MFEEGLVGLQMEATAPHMLSLKRLGWCAVICFMLMHRYIPVFAYTVL